LLADDLLDADRPVIGQLIDAALTYQGSILGVQEVPLNETDKYGIVATDPVSARTERVRHIVEKPKPDVAPSTLAVVGRYVLDARVFAHLRQTQAGAGGEIQLTDGIASLMKEKAVFAHRYEGVRYDCGNKEGWFRANVALGRKYHNLIP
jgi:UTP--glucose-1-phosphate uridylyltransferase